jgi:quercetin dioxygenase-like cupin family protein
MRTVRPDQARFIPPQPHRAGGVSFRHLLAGDDGAPDNYSLTLVQVNERYETPRHRHNFEQVRVMLEGRFGFGPGAVQEAGSVGYFCEGTRYTQRGEGPSTTLLLQCGGASGAGYMGFDALQRGSAELASRGRFADGVFSWLDAAGKKHNQDGYEAVWEHVHGRRLVYPQPRYQAPVIVWPEHFGWLPWTRGAALKRLGQFNERGLGVALWRLDPGAALVMEPASRRELLFVRSGTLGSALPAGSAIEVRPGETLGLRAGESGAELVGFSLPRFV